MNSLPSKLVPCLLSALALTGCGSSSPTPESNMRLFSPLSLHLKAGAKVQTIHGEYIPQVDEVWHSHADYMSQVYQALKP